MSQGSQVNKGPEFVTGLYYIGIIKSCPKLSKLYQNGSRIYDFMGKPKVWIKDGIVSPRNALQFFMTPIINIIRVIR